MTSTSGGSTGSRRSAGAKGPDELRQQIAMTRHRLGDTVEELVSKTDVKARARAQVAELKGSASHAAHSVRERVPRVSRGRTPARVPRAAVMGGVGVVGVAAAAAGVVVWRREAPRVLLRGRRRSSATLRRDLTRSLHRLRRK